MITLIHNLDFFDASLIVSALFCGLVTGFILTYAIVVMPGLAKLTDKNFLRAFQVTDEIIQNNQPLFMLIWIKKSPKNKGSVLEASSQDSYLL